MGLNETVPAYYPPSLYHESKKTGILSVGTFYITVSVTCVALRFVSRRLIRAKLWWDDWLSLATVPFIFGLCIGNMNATNYGWGRHSIVMYNTGPETMVAWAKSIWVLVFFYNPALALFKCSALALYIRIFGVYQWIRRSCIILSIIICFWALLSEFIHFFRCIPISGQWGAQAKCFLDVKQENLMLSIPTILFGVVTLILPIKSVFELKLSMTQRFGLFFVFLLGGLDLIISCIRLYEISLHATAEYTWDTVNLYYWSVAEPVSGLLCCCLPTYGPLFRALKKIVRPSSSDGPSGASSQERPEQYNAWSAQNMNPFGRAISTSGNNTNATKSSCEDDDCEIKEDERVTYKTRPFSRIYVGDNVYVLQK